MRRQAPGSLLVLLVLLACGERGEQGPSDPIATLRSRAQAAGVAPLTAVEPAPAGLVDLGRALFHDKILSGNRNIACSTCHSPVYHTTDLLTLSIGTGGTEPAAARQLGTGTFTTRNAPELFNRGHPSWRRLFWDGRIELTPQGLVTPAGSALPQGLAGPLAAQVLFPLIARSEMRGRVGENGIADLPDGDPRPMWDSLVGRLALLPGYDTLAAAAFPGPAPRRLTIVDVANAVAAFIGTVWSMPDAPFDRFLAGDDSALSPAAVRGGLLFFGSARCGSCHRGPLLTDQEFHNVGTPALGPGADGGPDLGRGGITGAPRDRYAFRTPSLRNVAHSPPYMHNGAYRSLADAVRHYRDVRQALQTFNVIGVDSRLRATVDLSPAGIAAVEATLDPRVRARIVLSEADIEDVLAFLRSLTDARSNILLGDMPVRVPSGLPVSDY